MKTMKKLVTSAVCLTLAAAFLFTDTTAVQAKEKTVTLDDSAVQNVTEISYKKADYVKVGTYDGSDYLDFYLYDETKKAAL
jgi:hypothetical protein